MCKGIRGDKVKIRLALKPLDRYCVISRCA